MRRFLLAVVVFVAFLALTLGSAAASSTGPSPRAADPTSIQAISSSAIVAGIQTTLAVSLQDTATAAPVGGAVLSFAEQTTFGWLALGNATTNAQGEAGVNYAPVSAGSYTIAVSYGGNATYAPTNATLTVAVIGAASPPPPFFTPDRIIVLVIVAVVGGVWLTYGFVALLVLGIRNAGSRSEEEELELEKEIMEQEENEAEKQSVPVAARANKAVVYLAISALILSGAAVAMLLTGGVAHTAAYTPSTVELQIAVIPDFRGGGWDSFVPNEPIVHAGDTVKITLYSTDTDMPHGFAIDALGIKIDIPRATIDNATGDIIPSVVTVPAFTVTAAGAFVFYCTAYCGDGHTTMTGTLVVLPDD